MGLLNEIYRPSTALLTDLYQITMAYGYWKNGMQNTQSAFHLFFRKAPFKGSYAIAAGLDQAIDIIEGLRFEENDTSFLSTLKGNDGKPLFEEAFLNYLKSSSFQVKVDAIPEGTVVFPHQPLLRIEGPIIPCQLLETALLTIINFQTLIATKSSRICKATESDLVLEFGLRRAQGIDGGISASRAAYIGGCEATSNVLASNLLNIPCKGTHAHSWVMMFDEEIKAFEAYSKAMPNNCIFLVDTYNTLKGVRKAIEVGRQLKSQGHSLVGIRLDSGDMASLSIQARRMLDEAGFHDAKIVASDSLDEHRITELKSRGAQIDIWGVGTNLVTARDQPALGGVYKLAAVQKENGDWIPKVKLSNSSIKVSNPERQQVRRFRDVDGTFIADMIFSTSMDPGESAEMIELTYPQKRHVFNEGYYYEDLLVPIFRDGDCVYKRPNLQEIQNRAKEQLSYLPERYRRLQDAPTYPSGLESQLHDLKHKLIEDAK